MSRLLNHAPPCSSPRWETWTRELKEEIQKHGPMSHREIMRWGAEFGLKREFCRHLVAYADDDLTPLPSGLWTLTPKWIPGMVAALSALSVRANVRAAENGSSPKTSARTRRVVMDDSLTARLVEQ